MRENIEQQKQVQQFDIERKQKIKILQFISKHRDH